MPLLDALSSQHGLLSHRLAGVRPACQNHSRSNLSQNLYFSTKDFPLGLPLQVCCISIICMGEERRLIFEYLDLCQRSGQYFGGDKTRDLDDEDTISIPF